MNTPAHGWHRGPSPTSGNSTPANPGTSVETGSAGAAAARIWQILSSACWRLWATIESRRATQRRRNLRVVETVGMGEKRFVAIVQVEQQQFLVGGGSAGVSLLARLDAAPEFAAALDPQQPDVQSANRIADRIANHIREAW